jgi:RHS repeat-associated protein
MFQICLAVPHSELNQYTNITGVAISFDTNFKETNNHYGQTFVYASENPVVNGSMQATYDGLGRCVRRTVGGNTVLFSDDGWNPIMEWDNGGYWKALTVYGAKPDEVLLCCDATYGWLIYKHDNQGSITSVLRPDNQIVEKYTYDAYGRPTILSATNTELSTSAVGNRFMFTGREWLADLQVYDYRHRLYDPDIGRFLQADPMGLQTEGEKLSAEQQALFSPGGVAPKTFTTSEMNLYRYCGDDPVDRSDPLGTLWRVDPNLPEDLQQHMQESIDSARKRDSNIDAKFAAWEKNPNAMNTITHAENPNNTADKLPDGSKGNGSDYSDPKHPDRNATIFWNPDNWKTRNMGDRDPIIALGHELPHGDQINEGRYTKDMLDKRAYPNEVEAIRFENLVRHNVDGSHREGYMLPVITYPRPNDQRP